MRSKQTGSGPRACCPFSPACCRRAAGLVAGVAYGCSNILQVTCTSSRRQHAGGSEQNARAPRIIEVCIVIYSFFALNAPCRSAAVRDTALAVALRLEIPRRIPLCGGHRPAVLRHRRFGVPHENVPRRIRRARARRCISTRRIPENPRHVLRAPGPDCNPAHFRAREPRARETRIRLVTWEFFRELRAIHSRGATFRICPKEAARALDGTSRATVYRLR